MWTTKTPWQSIGQARTESHRVWECGSVGAHQKHAYHCRGQGQWLSSKRRSNHGPRPVLRPDHCRTGPWSDPLASGPTNKPITKKNFALPTIQNAINFAGLLSMWPEILPELSFLSGCGWGLRRLLRQFSLPPLFFLVDALTQNWGDRGSGGERTDMNDEQMHSNAVVGVFTYRFQFVMEVRVLKESGLPWWRLRARTSRPRHMRSRWGRRPFCEQRLVRDELGRLL